MHRFFVTLANVSLLMGAIIASAATIEVYGPLYSVIGFIVIVLMQLVAIASTSASYAKLYHTEQHPQPHQGE